MTVILLEQQSADCQKGSGTGGDSGLYVPALNGRHVLNQCMNQRVSEGMSEGMSECMSVQLSQCRTDRVGVQRSASKRLPSSKQCHT